MTGYATPGQTVGPFFGYALPYHGGHELVVPSHPEAVRLHGRVTDGQGAPVPDALVEIWQPAPDGEVVQQPGSLHRDGWTFTGWGALPPTPPASTRSRRCGLGSAIPGRRHSSR